MRQDITMNDIDSVLRVNRLITQQSKGYNVKELQVSFDKEYFIMLNGVEQFRTTNKLLALNTYNEIKL